MNEPLVSILIPTYNRENFIAETIKSAQNQSYKNLEIIVVDNFSKDKTCEIVKKIATKDKRIKLFCNESNVGPVRNWLKCINLASGQYGKFLWSDDLIHPLFVEETLSLLLKNKKLAFVYTKVEVILSKTKKKYIYNLKKSGVFNSHTYIQYVLTNFKYPKSPGCAIFRMDDLRNNLVIDIPNDLGIDFSNEAIGNDLLLFLLTLAKHPFFGYINQPYAIFRQHSNSITEFTPKSKLTILYAYAKSYFIENYVKDKIGRAHV